MVAVTGDDRLARRRHPASHLAPLVGALAVVVLAAGGAASAHDGIAGSDPAAGAQLDEPIDEVLIDFGARIGDDAEIVVLDPDDEPLESQVEIVSDTEARVRFEPIDQQGTYIVRYLTSAIDDGHLLVGAISFTYGSPSSGHSVGTWALFGVAALAVLALGAWMSVRRARRRRSEVDQDLADVGV
jgi:methionine-rich copper-binding protein CopC